MQERSIHLRNFQGQPKSHVSLPAIENNHKPNDINIGIDGSGYGSAARAPAKKLQVKRNSKQPLASIYEGDYDTVQHDPSTLPKPTARQQAMKINADLTSKNRSLNISEVPTEWVNNINEQMNVDVSHIVVGDYDRNSTATRD